ncbi:potassium channel subfamily K member 16-like [Nelusetta ayraudi]|uniref:potassium channel subfamily K member 16-like n=1 Tax=Nelusetta ayraudi TaxID=303726 RepID=UPI003F6E9EE7
MNWTSLLTLAHFSYLLLGAWVFQALERDAESSNRKQLQLEKLSFLSNYTCLDVHALETFVMVIVDAWLQGVNPAGNSSSPSNWDFCSSFFFAGTVVTTIGYGNLSPSTVPGQVFCVFFALCGIPLNLLVLQQLVRVAGHQLVRLEQAALSLLPDKRGAGVGVAALGVVLASGSLLLLVVPPLLFSYIEGWTTGEGLYFAFITLSTIGFGDYVVGAGSGQDYFSVYRALAGVWLIFALAWLALLLNQAARLLRQRPRSNPIEALPPEQRPHQPHNPSISPTPPPPTST